MMASAPTAPHPVGAARRIAGLCLALLSSATFVPAVAARPSAATELQAVRLQPDGDVTRVLLDLSAASDHRFFILDAPRRAVIDLKDAREALRGALPAAAGAVAALRVGAQQDGGLRVVVELREGARASMGAPLVRGSGAQRLVLEVTGEAAPRATTTTTTAPAPVSPASQHDTATVAAADAAAPVALKPIKAAHAPAASGRTVVVAVDAGHGGQDPGAIGRGGTREKDVVLDIARTLAAHIDREPGMRAILTRDGDYFLTLRERIRRARDAGAMLFVSVHADAVRDPSVTGSSVYVLSDKGATDEQARMLADRENAADLAGGVSIDDKDPVLASVLVDVAQSAQIGYSMAAAERVLRSLGRVNVVRKPQVQQAGFVVLKSPDIPSMLVETAFISSPEDERLLGVPERRAALAEAIFDGVQQYFVDHPPDGSRFAEERLPQRAGAGRTAIATAPDAAAPPARPTGRL